jgi:hypothetical protein
VPADLDATAALDYRVASDLLCGDGSGLDTDREA